MLVLAASLALLLPGLPLGAQEDPAEAVPGFRYERLPDYLAVDLQRLAGIPRLEAHVVNSRAAGWRTGQIDPVVETLPPALSRALEADPEAAFPDLVAWFRRGAKDDYHLLKRFHDWIGLNIAYDYDAFMGRSAGSQEPSEVVRRRRTTCGGFARLFARLCDLAGVECRYIAGLSRAWVDALDDPLRAGMSGHAWNAVRLDGVWQIVDATTANRRAYDQGRFGELKAYRDGSLFLSPEAKLLGNAAHNLADQLVARPLTAKEFLAQPQVDIQLLREGLVLDATDLAGDLVKVVRRVPDSDKGQTADAWFPLAGRGSLVVDHPAGVSLRASLKEVATGRLYPLATAVLPEPPADPGAASPGTPKLDRVRSRVQLALPGPGAWECLVQAGRPSGSDPVLRQVWRFLVLVPADSPAARSLAADSRPGLALEEGLLVPLHRVSHLGLDPASTATHHLEPLAQDPAWLACDLPLAPGTEYYGSLLDAAGQAVPGAVAVSRPRPELLRLLVRCPEGLPGMLTVSGKKTGDKSFSHRIWQGLVPARRPDQPVLTDSTGKALAAPLGELVVRPVWHERGLPLPGRPVSRPDGRLWLPLSLRPDQRCRPVLQRPDKKDVPGQAFLLRETQGPSGTAATAAAATTATASTGIPPGTGWPAGAGVVVAPVPGTWATLYLFAYGPDGAVAVASLLLPPAPPGSPAGVQALLPAGTGLDLQDPLAAQCRTVPGLPAGGADWALGLELSPGYEAYVGAYRSDGTALNGTELKEVVQVSYPGPDRRIYYGRDQVPGGYWCQVFVRRVGDKDYRPVHVFGRWEPGLARPAGWPFTHEPQFTKRFAEEGLVTGAWSRSPGQARLSFRGPEDLAPLGLILTPEGKKGGGTCNVSRVGESWQFDFLFAPENGPLLTGKIYRRDEAGKLVQLVVLPLGEPAVP